MHNSRNIMKHSGMQITNYVANSHIIWECSYLNFSKSEEDSDSFPEFFHDHQCYCSTICRESPKVSKRVALAVDTFLKSICDIRDSVMDFPA